MFKMLNAGMKPAARIIAGVAVGATLLAGMAFAPAANAGTLTGFKDTPDWAWYAGAVKWVSQHGVMTGYNKNSFGPDDDIDREQTAVLLWKKAGHPYADETRLSDFLDGSTVSSWARQAVSWADAEGVMTGEMNGPFRLTANFNSLTREMLATVLARDAKVDTSNVSTAKMNSLRNSNRVSDWARGSVAWAVNKGILRGWPDSRGLDPQGTVTRAEAATMIARSMGANPAGALARKPAPKPKPKPAPRRPAPSHPRRGNGGSGSISCPNGYSFVHDSRYPVGVDHLIGCVWHTGDPVSKDGWVTVTNGATSTWVDPNPHIIG